MGTYAGSGARSAGLVVSCALLGSSGLVWFSAFAAVSVGVSGVADVSLPSAVLEGASGAALFCGVSGAGFAAFWSWVGVSAVSVCCDVSGVVLFSGVAAVV